MSTQYKAVIFDLGNVLFNIHFSNCFEVWAEKGQTEKSKIENSFKFDQKYEQHERSEISAEQYYSHVQNMIGTKLNFEDFEAGWNSIYGEVILETSSFIEKYKSTIKLFAFTNSNELHRSEWEQRYSKVLSDFSTVFCSSQIGKRKPEADAFELILENTGFKKSEVIFVDDLEENVSSAQEFGIRSILFKDPAASIKELEGLIFG